jgi:hypothetical protein
MLKMLFFKPIRMNLIFVKTNNPNILSNLQTNLLLFEKSSQIMKRKVILLLILVFFYSNSNAQLGTADQQNDVITVTNINSFFNAATKGTLSNVAKLNAENLKTLTTTVQPSVYCYSNTVNTYGDKPVNLCVDMNSFAQVDNLVTLKNNIEIVIIKIDNASQLNSSINLALLSNFKKLKYIYIASSIDISSSEIANMITNYDEKYSVFYKIDNGDNK